MVALNIKNVSFFVLFFAGFAFGAPVFAAAQQNDASGKDTVRVIILKNFPPQFVSTPEGPSGLAVEVMQDVARRVDLDIEFVTVKGWKDVYAPLKDGGADVLSSMGISEERKKIVEFTDPYEVFDIKLFIRAETEGIASLDDLGERVLGVQATNVLTKGLVQSGKYNIKKLASFKEAFLALLSGEVDAVLAPTDPFLLIARAAGLDGRIHFVGPSMLEIKRAIAVPKGQFALRDRLNRGLRELKHSDDYATLMRKWYGAPTPYWTSAKTTIAIGGLFAAFIVILLTLRYFAVLNFNRRIRANEERFSLALRGANDGLWDWNLKTGEIYYSPRWASMLGYDVDQLDTSLATWEGLVDPRDRDRVIAETTDYIEGKTDTFNTEFRMFHSDGSLVTVQSRGFLVKENGEAVRLVGTHVDVSLRKKDEEELIHHRDHLEELVAQRTAEIDSSRLLLQTIFDSLDQAVFVVDARTRNIINCNEVAENIFGYARDQMIGHNTRLFHVDEDAYDTFIELLYPALEKDGKFQTEFMLRRSDGSEFQSEHTVTAVRDETGEFCLLISTVRDITEKKKIEEQLENHRVQLEKSLEHEKQYSALQQKFVAIVSHEFRTPLTIIDGTAQRLIRRKDKLDADEVEMRANKMRAAVTRMISLIDTTLYVSQLDAGKIEMQSAPSDIGKLLHDVCERQAEISPEHQFIVEAEGLPKEMQIDIRMLDQIFTNLLSNAVKYAPQAPHIEVKGWQENEEIVITVTDHGVGIPQDELPHMFERFFRASNAEVVQGTGLGLNVCKEFVEMHDGSIAVTSEEGEGTTFTVRLPVIRQGHKNFGSGI